MFLLFVFLLTLKVFATITSCVYAIKIARLKLTQTYTWLLFAVAFGLRFLTQMQSMVYAESILGLYKQFDLSVILLSQFVEVIIVISFMVGVLRSYYGVVNAKLKFEK